MRKGLFFSFLLLFTLQGFSQDKPRVYLSGIADRVIKISQLSDASIKIVTSIDVPNGTVVKVYFSGVGFPNGKTTTVSIGAPLNSIRNGLLPGSQITISGFATKDPQTKKNIYFEESWYKIIDD